MPAYAELDLVADGENYEIRTHDVNRQDSTKASYTWPKVRITGPVDWNVFIAEWSEAVEVEGDLESLIATSLNHGISVQKDPNRESADPVIKEFKSNFRKAMSLQSQSMVNALKADNEDLFNELRDDFKAKILAKQGLLD